MSEVLVTVFSYGMAAALLGAIGWFIYQAFFTKEG